MASRAVAEAAPRAVEPGRANRGGQTAVQTSTPRPATTSGSAVAPRARVSILPVGALSSGVVDISSSTFDPSQAVTDEIAASGGKGLDVRVITKGLTEEGRIKVRQDSNKKFDSMTPGSMPLLNPWTQKLGGMHVNFAISNSAIKDGHASLKPRGGSRHDWVQTLQKNSNLLGGLGLKIDSLPKPVNTFENGKLVLGVTGAKIVVGGYVDATFDLLLENMTTPRINGSADIDIRGAVKGELKFDNTGDQLKGSVSLAVNFKSFSGAVKVAYLADGTVDISGKAAYNADKLSGEIQFVATDLDAANKFARDAITAAGGKENVQEAARPAPVPVPKEGQKKRALAATGQLGFNLTKWFAGTVNVVVDGKGAITVIGKIAPPGEVRLFDEKPWDKELVKFEAKAYYGIPVVGNLNLFANISLHAIAKLGPAKLYNIEILRTYSTDPEIQKSIQISGSLNISAYGGLRLRAEGGAGIEILKHDLKFGIGLNADVGVKAYADARPTIGYRDPGIFYISGTLDLVAQPILGLGGEFFIELDAPWFSPIDDDRWSWPLFSKEWPLGDPIGISASVKEYVLGSGAVPEITMKPPEFDPSKFMTNMVDDKLPGKSGGPGGSKGAFKEDGSVPKPVVPPKKAAPKATATKPVKKGAPPKASKSANPDPKGPKERKNTDILKIAAEKVAALKGKAPLTEAALDGELTKIKKQVSGTDFSKKLNGTKWLVTPKTGGRSVKKAIEIGAKSGGDVQLGVPQDPKQRLTLGLDAAEKAVDALSGTTATKETINLALNAISVRYAFTKLTAHVDSNNIWWVDGAINPTGSKKTRKTAAEKKAEKNAAAAQAVKPNDLIIMTGGGGAVSNPLTVTGVTATHVLYGTGNMLSKASYGIVWKLYDDRASLWPLDRIEKANAPATASKVWPDYKTANRCLNYRHHNFQLNPPGGKQWEHVVEQSFGFKTGAEVNSVTNIALTDGTFNQWLNKVFRQVYSVGDIKGLPGSDGKPLRVYLLTRPSDEQVRWKEALYRLEGKSIILETKDPKRGPYQVLK